MTVLPPRPRFHVVLWSQLIAGLMVLSGMFPYWIHLKHSWVPPHITGRTIGVASMLFLMFVVPFVANFWDNVFGNFNADSPHNRSEPLAENATVVRRIIWSYCLIDLLLLTYLVHITGGLIGSMYAGLYLLIPSLALLLMLGSADLRKTSWLIALAMAGIALAFWMCWSPGRIEHDTSQHREAFSLAVALVSWEGAILLFIQVAILKRQVPRYTTSGPPS